MIKYRDVMVSGHIPRHTMHQKQILYEDKFSLSAERSIVGVLPREDPNIESLLLDMSHITPPANSYMSA